MPDRDANKTSSGATKHGKVNPIQMQKHLKGVNYPASKEDLVRQAQTNQASPDIVDTLRHMPGSRYDSPKDVMKALGSHE